VSSRRSLRSGGGRGHCQPGRYRKRGAACKSGDPRRPASTGLIRAAD